MTEVNFKYKNSTKIILESIDMSVREGMKVGLIGSTGSGKTTLALILAGLYEATSGRVQYSNNGIKLSKPKVSIAMQEGFLFDTTIEENIKLGNRLMNDEEYHNIVKICLLEKTLRECGETTVGENGVNLSGGERRRVIIAQALANKSASIFVFDEFSSGLDNETAETILKNIFDYTSGKIVIFIEHNHKLLTDCDEIYLVRDKKIELIQ